MFRPKSKILILEGVFLLPSKIANSYLEGNSMYVKKSVKLLNVRYDIRGPISDEADRSEREGAHIIRLYTGNPAAFGIAAPPSVIDSLVEYADISAPYSMSKGLPKAREAIARYSTSKGITGICADDVYAK